MCCACQLLCCRGGFDGFLHPVDHVVKPLGAVSLLAYDTAMVVAWYNAPNLSEDVSGLHQHLMQNQQTYHDSFTRIQQFGLALQKEGIDFSQASIEDKTRIVSRVTTTVLAPGPILRR